ncbi:hypothetical protein DL89DRAFT_320413 [Linderina pennispora]|uniref:Small-subunit processome Utp12 domain-containing protein n=1 Tax=Linderina pennispora TaxID=61395 RepID=A0A1Y1WP49_9FUNG|nr:uncharacterized protein DL89DRAFT_320413 [Linderina pennispora]ORX75036.1 hypothetical protein DL89DRAFT_320413 [Linderina pennispora]
MAKKTVRRSKSQGSKAQNQATKTRSEATEITRWTCAFDNINGTESSLALVRSGVNGHQLRIIDIHTGTQRSEHLTENGVKIRSVAWGQLPSADKKNAGGSKQVVVALALQNGQIQIYSPARDTVVKTLEGEHENPVVDLAFGPDGSGQLVSVDESGLLVQWDIAVGSALNQINTGIHEARKLIVSSDGQRAVIGSHKLEMWDLGKQSMLQSWPGHTSPIFSLEWAADETALIWDASPTASSATVMRARAILAIDSDVVYAHVSVDGSVLAIGEDGVMYVWHQVAVAQRDSSAKAKSDIGQAADGVVRIPGQVMIIRGSALMPVFETLSIVDSTGQFERSLVLTRAPQKNILVSSARSEAEQKLAKQQQKYDDSSASVISPVVEAVAKSQKVASESSKQEMPSLAERVKQLSAGTDDEDAEMQDGKVGKQLTVGTLVRVLVQALHTDDQEMLNMVIDNSSRTNVVRDTVLGLPTMYVLSFLQQLFVRFQTTPAKASTLLPWIRTTLTLHSAYLTTIPNLIPQLSGFYQGVEARLETHQKLLRLNGRLELVHTQIRTRELVEKDKSGRKLAQQSTPVKKSKAMKPLNVYRESDSEDDEEVDAATAWQAEESTDDDADMASDAESDNQWSDGEEEIDGVEAAASDDEDEDEGDESGSEQSGEEDDLEHCVRLLDRALWPMRSSLPRPKSALPLTPSPFALFLRPDTPAYFMAKPRYADLVSGLSRITQEYPLGRFNKATHKPGKWIKRDKLEKKLEIKITENEYRILVQRLCDAERARIADPDVRTEVRLYLRQFERGYTHIEVVKKDEENMTEEEKKAAERKALLRKRKSNRGYKDDLGRAWVVPVNGQLEAAKGTPAPAVESEAAPAAESEPTPEPISPILAHPGEVLVNGKPLAEYFARTTDRESVLFPFQTISKIGQFNVYGVVHGGGLTGQAEALQLAIARATHAMNRTLHDGIRRAGLLRRDPENRRA